jgi:2-oxoglutarate dehydrogenase E2 component (dihydrolipoamide succinyltransferase)
MSSSLFYTTRRAFAVGDITTMKVPTMGDSITEGTIVEWVKKTGEFIAKDDVLVVVETDKVSVDVRASVSGIVQEHKASGT